MIERMETSYASNLDVVLGFVNGVYGIIFFTSIYLSFSLFPSFFFFNFVVFVRSDSVALGLAEEGTRQESRRL